MTQAHQNIFADILQQYSGFIRSSLQTYEHDKAQREELYQDVALALWRALPGFRGEASYLTFIARITHNIGVSHVRKAMSRPTTEILEDSHVSSEKSPETQAQQKGQKEILLQAIGALPLGLRQTVSLYLEDFSNREIADILGLSEGNVAVRLTRARTRLSKYMEKIT